MSISSFIPRLNFFRIKPTNKYKRGVSIIATLILKIMLDRTKPKNKSQAKISKKHRRDITVVESIICEEKVEKLFLSQRYFPLVSCFQKW